MNFNDYFVRNTDKVDLGQNGLVDPQVIRRHNVFKSPHYSNWFLKDAFFKKPSSSSHVKLKINKKKVLSEIATVQKENKNKKQLA